jgi:hypothetical protein
MEPSPESLKAILLGFADGTYLRRPITSAQIPADAAPPNRERLFPTRCLRSAGRTVLRPFAFIRWTALRDRLQFSLAAQHILGNVESAVTGTPVYKVSVSVVTWTDDVKVLLPLAVCEAARASPVSVSPFVDEQAFHQLPCEFLVRVKVISTGLRLAIQSFVEGIYLLRGSGCLLVHIALPP